MKQTGQNVQVELKQKLSLSLEMRQSLKILEMPLHDLCELVTRNISENPMLELDADNYSSSHEFESLSLSELDADSFIRENIGSGGEADEISCFEYQSFTKRAAARIDSEKYLSIDSEETFSDKLFSQLDEMELSPSFFKLCRYIVECLDERGYFDCDPSELSQELKLPLCNIMQALYIVQGLQPAGVGARSLQECLTLQLINSKDFNPYTVKIVNEGLRLLADNNLPGIANLISADTETTIEACRAVKALNPIPSRGFNTGQKAYFIIPDAIIRKDDGCFRVVMNDCLIPKLELSRENLSLLETEKSPETQRYLKENLQNAHSLIRSVNDRYSTLARIIDCIIQKQPCYFENGQNLSPMTLSDIARELCLNISTVSRAVQEKYVNCVAGTVSLKSLFTGGIVNEQGNTISRSLIEGKLKACIQAEAPGYPLSDDDLRRALKAMNIDISRRTVTKYREELGIPSIVIRKNQINIS